MTANNSLKTRRFNELGLRLNIELVDETDTIVHKFRNKPIKKAKTLLEELFNLKLK